MEARRPGDEVLDVIVQVAPARHALPPTPPVRWLFAATLAVASLIAVVGGLPLGFLAATDWVVDRRWTEAVQAHGRLQLFAWAAPVVIALAFEFLPRLNERPFLPGWPRVTVLAVLVAGAFLQAIALVFRIDGLMLPGTALVLAAAVAFGAAVVHMRYRGPLTANPQALFFPAAAAWLMVAAGIAVASELRLDAQIVPLDDSRLMIEVFARGFLLHAIVGVALRAFPGHLDVADVPNGRQWVMLAGLSLSLAVWALGAGGLGRGDDEVLRRAGDITLAATIVVSTAWLGVLSSPRKWFAGPIYALLVPVAWLGLVVYAGVLAAVAFAGSPAELTLWEEGAARHALLLGFVAPLILAMAYIVLDHFGIGRIVNERLLGIAFVLLVVALPLRVVPMVAQDAPDDAARALLGAAGVVAMAAFALAALVFARTALAIRRAG
ncbi:MAG: hypothetical protein Kow0010_02000 [Dehalococcoidia bacterium]